MKVHTKVALIRHQRGFVAVLLLVMLTVAAVAALSANLWGAGNPKAYEKKITRQALQQAKEALLAHIERGEATDLTTALVGTTAGTPGIPAAARLVCTDLDGDGLETVSCGTGNVAPLAGMHSLGLLPWRTLGIPKLKDGTNECLWYAVSGGLKNLPSTPGINGDSNGQFSVIQPVKTIQPTTGVATWSERFLVGDTSAAAVSSDRAVAVIISPGTASRTQNRRPLASSRECPLPVAATGVPNAESSALRYLDAYTGITSGNNAAIVLPATGPKIWVQADEDHEKLNDELIWITAQEFSNAAAKRTLNLYKAAINAFVYGRYDAAAGAAGAYVPGNGFYPTAASTPGGPCVAGRLRGYVPYSCAGMPLGIGPQMGADGWSAQAHYAVSESCVYAPSGQVLNTPPFTASNPPPALCAPGARITVGSDTASVHALILMRGRARTGQGPCDTFANMHDCIEHPKNQSAVLSGNTLTSPYPTTIAPITYMPIASGSNDLLHLFQQRTR
jgi:hypothetical protein